MTASQQIRRAGVDDLARLGDLAKEFYAASKFLEEFDLDLFVEFWTSLLASGAGGIFLLEQDAEILGTLGAVAHREPYNRRMVAHEFFFFLRKRSRGGMGYLRLYRAFEQWAFVEKDCASLQMVHLQDSMPDKLKHFYGRLGYEAAETVYVKRRP